MTHTIPKTIRVTPDPLTIDELMTLSDAADAAGDALCEDAEIESEYRHLAARCRALALQLQLQSAR